MIDKDITMDIKCPICNEKRKKTIKVDGDIPLMVYRYACLKCKSIYDYELQMKITNIKVIVDTSRM